MKEFQPGDLITFRLREDHYGLAKILRVENLALHDHFHLAIYDPVLEAGPGGHDSFGDWMDRTHDQARIDQASVAIDHLGITYDALMQSSPLVVGHSEVDDRELDGYQLWLHVARAQAVERGLMREEDEKEEQNAGDVEESDPEEEASDRHTGDDADEQETITVFPWHARMFDVSIDRALFEMGTTLDDAGAGETEIGAFILSSFEEGNEHIEELVEQFVDGDYAAGQELMDFGDAAADALSRHLQDDIAPELADDILQILGGMGSERAYKHIAAFFGRHPNPGNDPLGLPAARGYCFAVMMSQGDSGALREHLQQISALSGHPELREDVAGAVEAMNAWLDGNQPDSGSAIEGKSSTDPFGF